MIAVTPSLPIEADTTPAVCVELLMLDVFLLTELEAILATLAAELPASPGEIVCSNGVILTSTNLVSEFDKTMNVTLKQTMKTPINKLFTAKTLPTIPTLCVDS